MGMINKLVRLSLAILLAGATVQSAAAQTTALRPIKARMDWVPTGIYGAFYYGQKRGIYAREGFNVEVLPGQGANAALDALNRGDIDFAFVSCWAAAIGISKGRESISVATFTGRLGFAFFYPKDSDVKSLKDLAGKTIVVSAGMDTQLFPAVLTSNGLSGDLMKRVHVDPANKVSTYTRGQADVVNTHLASGYTTISKQRASNYISWSSVGFVLPDFCIITTKERLAKEPQMVEKFVRATLEAADEGAKKPADVAAAGVEMFPLMDKANTENEWKLMTELFFSDDTKGCPHGWHSPKDWGAALVTLQQHGGLEGSITDHSRFYTNRFFTCNR